MYDTRFTVDQILDRVEYDAACHRYAGDSFPQFHPNFGPGILADFVGGRADHTPETGTTWFYPGRFEGLHIKDIHLEYREDSRWLERLVELGRRASERFEGNIQIAMTDMGGTMDVLASLRPAELLLTDFYDFPEEVERLMWEVHDMWFRYFDLISRACKNNPGYSSWAGVFSSEPAYMLQCDFCYMLGPEMFDRFVLPELAASCKRLPGGSFFHQDGVGQLPHTQSLHGIPELAGIQWQPGTGDWPGSIGWHDQQRLIRDDGKLSQTWGGPEDLEKLIDAIGDVSHLVIIGHGDSRDDARFRKIFDKFGVE